MLFIIALFSRLSLCKILAKQKEQFCCHLTRFLGSDWPTNAFAAGAPLGELTAFPQTP